MRWLLSIAAVALLLALARARLQGPPPAAPAAAVHPDRITILVMGEGFVRRQLKSPRSAKFQNEEVRANYNTNMYSVIGYVDAMNSFGAMLRNQFVIIMMNTCKDFLTRRCWSVVKLGIGNQKIIDRPMPGTPRPGSRLVLLAQKKLIALGYDPGAADGVFGPKTKAAILKFQKEHDIPETGIVTELLIGNLDKVENEGHK